MAVKIELHDGREVEYENAVRVLESKYDYVLLDSQGAVLAKVQIYDVRTLHTKDPIESR